MKVQHFVALLTKDFKSNYRNGSIMMISVLPVLFTILYKSFTFAGTIIPIDTVLSIGLLMNMCLFPVSTMATVISEEKEKNTLRVLMLSGISGLEFLFSKAVVAFCTTEAINIVIYLLAGTHIHVGLFLFLTVLLTIDMLIIGALIGIMSKSQAMSSVYYTPIMLGLLIPAFLANMNKSIETVARLLPTYVMINSLLGKGIDFSLLVILVWLLVGFICFMFAYRSKMKD